MNNNTKNLARSVSIMAVLGWLADTCASVSLHRGWWSIIPLFNTVMTVVLAISLYRPVKRA